MGCGAVCGNNSSIYQPNRYSHQIVIALIPLLKHQKKFISKKQYNLFINGIKQNPLKYRLKIGQRIIQKQEIDCGILRKWKVILYCIDSSKTQYHNCLCQLQAGTTYLMSSQVRVQNQFQQHRQARPQLDPSSIVSHCQFGQIQKDLHRTCQLPQNCRKPFQNILKRLTNYFPKMGYTQGINFIVGYLLMIGLEEFDVFWMFVHIAINSRYLLLGLFQDSFPLTDIYKHVFKNVLRRENSQVYHHLYQQMQIDQAVWVFKWFLTYFIYSFPHQMIKYVFDIVIQIGGIGLITFAVAITDQLAPYLLLQNDVCELSIFFQQLRDLNVFNKFININKVVEKAYKIQIKKQDFQSISKSTSNFYVEYITTSLQQNQLKNQTVSIERTQIIEGQQKKCVSFKDQKMSKSQILLKNWYQKLINQKVKFTQQSLSKLKSIQNKQPQMEIFLTQNQDDHQSNRNDHQSNRNDVQCQQNQNKNSAQDSTQIKNNTIPSTGYSFNKKSSRLRNGDLGSEIDQLWDEEDQKDSHISKQISKQSNHSRTQNIFTAKSKKTTYQDQLDKFATTQNMVSSKLKFPLKPSSIFSPQSTFQPKINNFHPQPKVSQLMRAAQSMLNNISLTNTSHYQSSTSSKLSKKNKQTDLTKNVKLKLKSNRNIIHFDDGKTKTEEKQSLNDQLDSQYDSYAENQQSICASNQDIQQQIKNQHCSMKAFQSHTQRLNTHKDILINSLQVSQVNQTNNVNVNQSISSQIQIFQAQQVFKKKNRISSRINGAINSAANQNVKRLKLNHTNSDMGIIQLQKSELSPKKRISILSPRQINYDQSYESIFVPSEGQKSTQFHFKEEIQQYQIESVK